MQLKYFSKVQKISLDQSVCFSFLIWGIFLIYLFIYLCFKYHILKGPINKYIKVYVIVNFLNYNLLAFYEKSSHF